MASQVNKTSRVALGDLNVNSPVASPAQEGSKGKSCPEKPRVLDKAISLQVFVSKRSLSTREIDGMADIHGALFPGARSSTGRPHKKHKTEAPHESASTIGYDGKEIEPEHVVFQGDLPGGLHREVVQPQLHQACRRSGSAASSIPTSPSSTSTSSTTSTTEDYNFLGVNDSQDTVITEPDSPVTRFLTSEELRQKAQAMKLRLRLAAYKVRSNQMDIPISQLKIKTIPTSPKLPTLPRPCSANTSQRRTPLPSVIPNIKLSIPTTEHRETDNMPSSPPPQHATENASEKEPFATPLLPRQRHGLLNPPTLGSPIWKDKDLTSSAVKGKAADSLLSLMRQ